MIASFPRSTWRVCTDKAPNETHIDYYLLMYSTLHPIDSILGCVLSCILLSSNLCVLSKIANGMRSTIVTAPNYAELKLVHTFRRLLQNPAVTVTTQQKQDLARRLSISYRILQNRCADAKLRSRARERGDDSDGGIDHNVQEVKDAEALATDMAALRKRIESYQRTLDHWGLRDYQVPFILINRFSSSVIHSYPPPLPGPHAQHGQRRCLLFKPAVYIFACSMCMVAGVHSLAYPKRTCGLRGAFLGQE